MNVDRKRTLMMCVFGEAEGDWAQLRCAPVASSQRERCAVNLTPVWVTGEVLVSNSHVEIKAPFCVICLKVVLSVKTVGHRTRVSHEFDVAEALYGTFVVKTFETAQTLPIRHTGGRCDQFLIGNLGRDPEC